MSWTRRLWFALTVVAVVVAVAVVVGAMYGEGGVVVESVSAESNTPTNVSANCEDVVVRNVVTSVTVARDDLGLENPLFWDVGITVRGSALGSTENSVFTLGPSEERTVSLSFTRVRERTRAPREHVDVALQVSRGNAVVAESTASTVLQPVKAGESC